MSAGILVWGYTLLLPSISDAGIVGAHILAEGPFGIGWLRPQALVRPRPAAARSRRAFSVSPSISSSISPAPSLPAADRDRARAGGLFVPSTLAPMAPSFRLWRASVTIEELTATIARYLGEERTRESVRELRRLAPHHDRAAGRGRLPAAAIRRISAGVGDRRCVLAPRALAAAAQAHGVDQGRAQAARRCQRRDPLQSRNSADRARSRAAGHRRVRQGARAGLLEPAVRRNLRSAARADPHRHRARRDPAPYRPAKARDEPADLDAASRRAHRQIHVGGRAVPRTFRRARTGNRSARRTACPTADWSRPSPTSRRA